MSSHPTPVQHKRKKKFIDRHVQGALVRRMAAHYVIFFAALFVLSFVLKFLSDPLAPTEGYLSDIWATQKPLMLTALFLFPAFLHDTVKLSHRFVGPIYRIRNSIREAGRGEPNRPIQLRPRDFWKDVADDMNSLMHRIEQLEEAASQNSERELVMSGDESR